MSFYDSLKAFINRTVELFMSWLGNHFFYTSPEIKTPRGLLRFFDAAGNFILVFGVFLGIAWSKWRRSSCPGNVPLKQWVVCSWEVALPCAMVLLIGLVFYLSRRSAKVELFIADKLFPEGRVPDYWIGPKDPRLPRAADLPCASRTRRQPTPNPDPAWGLTG